MLSLCPFEHSADVWAFVIGLSQISSFFSFVIKIICIPDEDYNFTKRPSGGPLHTLPKIYDVPFGFCPLTLTFGSIVLYLRSPNGCCGRRRVVVTRHYMICRDIVISYMYKMTIVMFPEPQFLHYYEKYQHYA